MPPTEWPYLAECFDDGVKLHELPVEGVAFAAWLLKTWRSERLRPAHIFLSEHVPWFEMMAACIGLSA